MIGTIPAAIDAPLNVVEPHLLERPRGIRQRLLKKEGDARSALRLWEARGVCALPRENPQPGENQLPLRGGGVARRGWEDALGAQERRELRAPLGHRGHHGGLAGLRLLQQRAGRLPAGGLFGVVVGGEREEGRG